MYYYCWEAPILTIAFRSSFELCKIIDRPCDHRPASFGVLLCRFTPKSVVVASSSQSSAPFIGCWWYCLKSANHGANIRILIVPWRTAIRRVKEMKDTYTCVRMIGRTLIINLEVPHECANYICKGWKVSTTVTKTMY